MKVTQLYDKFKAGEVSKEKFLYEVRRNPELINTVITNTMNFDDTVRVLKHRNLIIEAPKPTGPLNIDQVNPYEYRKGLDYELGLCGQAIPQWGIDFTGNEAYAKSQKKVLANLTKDALYYTHLVTGQQKDDSQDMVPFKKGNNIDKKNAVKNVKGHPDAKSNVKVNLGKKEAKTGKPKGVKEMTTTPKKQKGVKVMEVPKEYGKTVKLKSLVPKKKSSLKEGFEDVIDPQSPENILPFSKVRPGMTAHYEGEPVTVIAIGNYYDLKKYDGSGAIGDYLGSDPSGVDGSELIAVKDEYGRTSVQIYGETGAFVPATEEKPTETLGGPEDAKSKFNYNDIADPMDKSRVNEDDWLDSITNDDNSGEGLPHSFRDNRKRLSGDNFGKDDGYKGDPEFRDDYMINKNIDPNVGSLTSLLNQIGLDKEDDEWIDPAGGTHYGDDDDPAAMYAESGNDNSEINLDWESNPSNVQKLCNVIWEQLASNYGSPNGVTSIDSIFGNLEDTYNDPEVKDFYTTDSNTAKEIYNSLPSNFTIKHQDSDRNIKITKLGGDKFKYQALSSNRNMSEDDLQNKQRDYSNKNVAALTAKKAYNDAELQKARKQMQMTNENTNNMKLSNILKTVKLREDAAPKGNGSEEAELQSQFYQSPISQPKLEMGKPKKGTDGSYWVEISLPNDTILSKVQLDELMKMSFGGYKFAGINPKSDTLVVAVYTPQQ